MHYRGVLAMGLMGGAFALLASCSAADPNTVNFEEKPKSGDNPGVEGGTTSSSGGTEGGTTEGGTEAGVDAGPPNAFTGAPAFDSAMAAMTKGSNNASHTFAGMNPVDQPCLTCHVTGGPGSPWEFGGTVYNSSAVTAIQQFAEIRIVDSKGNVVGDTYSDNLGNFWTGYNAPIPDGSMVGVRTATAMKFMNTKLGATSGSCAQSGCHTASGGQGRLYVQ